MTRIHSFVSSYYDLCAGLLSLPVQRPVEAYSRLQEYLLEVQRRLQLEST